MNKNGMEIRTKEGTSVSAQPELSIKLGRSFFPFAVHIRTDHHLINATSNQSPDYRHHIHIIRFALSYEENRVLKVSDDASWKHNKWQAIRILRTVKVCKNRVYLKRK